MKPIIFYVDDEPHNLTVFEASLPTEWDIRTFTNPFEALEQLEKVSPTVIVSDQRMPGITGVGYLELAKKIHPHAVRIIVTGYSEENLVIESVRKAQIFDYINKPWEPDELEASLRRAIDFYRVNEEAREFQKKLQEREAQLVAQNAELLQLTTKLQESNQREQEIRKELECWVPPFVLWSFDEEKVQFPVTKDIVGITFDIVQSNQIHSFQIDGRSLRSRVIQLFSEAVLRNGGWRESHSGDSAYGHFGLLESSLNPFEAALGAAREFRVSLRSLSEVHSLNIECGIALHVARGATVDVHTVQLNTPKGIVVQKSFDTTSIEIDLLHRMEKLAHNLPGTNIIMSAEFFQSLKVQPAKVIDLGECLLKGQSKPVSLFLIASDKVSEGDLAQLKQSLLPAADNKQAA